MVKKLKKKEAEQEPNPELLKAMDGGDQSPPVEQPSPLPKDELHTTDKTGQAATVETKGADTATAAQTPEVIELTDRDFKVQVADVLNKQSEAIRQLQEYITGGRDRVNPSVLPRPVQAQAPPQQGPTIPWETLIALAMQALSKFVGGGGESNNMDITNLIGKAAKAEIEQSLVELVKARAQVATAAIRAAEEGRLFIERPSSDGGQGGPK